MSTLTLTVLNTKLCLTSVSLSSFVCICRYTPPSSPKNLRSCLHQVTHRHTDSLTHLICFHRSHSWPCVTCKIYTPSCLLSHTKDKQSCKHSYTFPTWLWAQLVVVQWGQTLVLLSSSVNHWFPVVNKVTTHTDTNTHSRTLRRAHSWGYRRWEAKH